jgi:hypothetical protein
MNAQSDLSAPPSVWEFLKRSGPEDGLHAVRLDTNTGPKLTSGPDWQVRRAAAEGTYYRDESEMERFASIATDKLSQEGFVFHAMRASRNMCAKEEFKVEVRRWLRAGGSARPGLRGPRPRPGPLPSPLPPPPPPTPPLGRFARPTTRSTSKSSAQSPLWKN